MSKGYYTGMRIRDRNSPPWGSAHVTCPDGQALKPEPSQELWNHSPDGFEWGHKGSGPAQLALAILLDYLKNKKVAVKLHQLFKGDYVAGFDREGWTLSVDDLEIWIDLAKAQYKSFYG